MVIVDGVTSHWVGTMPRRQGRGTVVRWKGATLVLFSTATGQQASIDDEPVPLEECTRPGTIQVTPRALDLAKRFQADAPAGLIVVFSWYDGEGVRAGKDAPWVDKGSGLDLWGYRVEQIPAEAVHHEGSFRYAVLVPKEVIESHPQGTIDLDGSRNLVLR